MISDLPAYPFEKLRALIHDVAPVDPKNIIRLSIGEPAFATPDAIQSALQRATPTLSQYPATAAIPALSDAIFQYIFKRFGVRLPENTVLPALGSREMLNLREFSFDILNPRRDSLIRQIILIVLIKN